MSIVVRHDPDYLNAYAQLAMQSQQSRQNYEPTPETDANPYTMSTQKGAALSQKLASDRERLGQKQKAKYGADAFKDTEAGFDWMTPISVNGHTDEQGRPLNTTIYRRDGVDPLRTGAWGALGSAEHQINDPGGVINPNDPRDRANVEALSRSGLSGDVSEDPFLTPEQLADKKFERGLGNKRKELELSDEFAQQKEGRNFANNLAQDEVRYKIQEQRDQNKLAQQSDKNLQGAKGSASGFFGTDFSDPATIKMLGPEVAAELQKKKNQYGAVLADKDKILDKEQQAKELEQLVRDGEAMMRLAQRDQMQQFEQVLDANGNPTGLQRDGKGRVSAIPASYNQKRSDTMEDYAIKQGMQLEQYKKLENIKYQLKEQYADKGMSDELAARYTLQAHSILSKQMADEGKMGSPSEQAVLEKASELSGGAKTLQSGSVNMGKPPIVNDYSSRKPIRVSSLSDVGRLPSGTTFIDPDGIERRVP